MTHMHPGLPFLFDDATENVVGVKQPNGGETMLLGAQYDSAGNYVSNPTAEAAHAAQHAGMGVRASDYARRSSLSVPLRICGTPGLSSLTNVTRHCTRALYEQFAAWRATVHHVGTATPAYKVAIATGSDSSDLYGANASWTTALWSGATSKVAPAAAGTLPNHQFSSITSDLMLTSSAASDNLIYIRSNADIANNTKFDLSIDLKGLAAYGYQTAYQANVDGVTTPASFSSPAQVNGFPPVTIELFGAGQINTAGIFGSSTAAGTGDTTNIGWAWRTEQALNAAGGKLWSLANLSAPSSTTDASILRAIAEVNARAYHAAIFWAYSTNDTDAGTAAGDTKRRGQIIQFIETCRARGTYPILATFQSATSMTAPMYASCKVANAFARQLSAAGFCGLLDFASILSDETQATATWKSASYTDDGTHPNSVAQPLLVAQTTAVLKAAFL